MTAKIKRFISILSVITILFGISVLPVSAAETYTADEIEIIIENDDISDETLDRIMAFYLNGDDEKEDDGVETCGLTCSLFGHKLESSTVSKITHKARTTAPRCLKKIYKYETCTRCDYEKSTLQSSTYINCCS